MQVFKRNQNQRKTLQSGLNKMSFAGFGPDVMKTEHRETTKITILHPCLRQGQWLWGEERSEIKPCIVQLFSSGIADTNKHKWNKIGLVEIPGKS